VAVERTGLVMFDKDELGLFAATYTDDLGKIDLVQSQVTLR
jgi:hypothetical protein